MSFIQSGQGSIGKIIYDPSLFDRANSAVTQLQQIMTQINSPHGTIGKLLNSDELYNKANATIDNVNKIIDEVNSGQGTIGKFLKDPSLYDNANKMVANGNQLVSDINAGKGTLGRLAKDEALAKKIDNTITRLNNIADWLDKGEGTRRQVPQGPCALQQCQRPAGRDPQPDQGGPPGSEEVPHNPPQAVLTRYVVARVKDRETGFASCLPIPHGFESAQLQLSRHTPLSICHPEEDFTGPPTGADVAPVGVVESDEGAAVASPTRNPIPSFVHVP